MHKKNPEHSKSSPHSGRCTIARHEVLHAPRQDSLYRCKKCRRLVATQQNVVSVPEGAARRRSFLNTWSVRPAEAGGVRPTPCQPAVTCVASLAVTCRSCMRALCTLLHDGGSLGSTWMGNTDVGLHAA